MFDRTGPTPIYVQVKEWIRQQILSGAWPRHYRLPPEIDLAAAWQLNRGTVRKAIGELVEEGTLLRTHGRGTFVASDALDQALAERLVTFSEDLINRGIPFSTRVLEQVVLHAQEELAARFELPPEAKLFFLKRLRLVDGVPIIVLHNYVVYGYCPGIERVDFTRHRLFEVLEKHFGLQLHHGRRWFQAQRADAEAAGLLGIPGGEPVMYIEQRSQLEDDALVEFSELWLRGDRFRLTAELRRDALRADAVTLNMVQHAENAVHSI